MLLLCCFKGGVTAANYLPRFNCDADANRKPEQAQLARRRHVFSSNVLQLFEGHEFQFDCQTAPHLNETHLAGIEPSPPDMTSDSAAAQWYAMTNYSINPNFKDTEVSAKALKSASNQDAGLGLDRPYCKIFSR